eukprot:TRINITY_DN2524_c0_g1_i4.p1 TRINITY_DN2524_c0_g1~~TRINITY_DN2524_c0_g1_i4.p1  ORF type:complete len:2370 (-),score=537.29 TRINITY_DN2524_c0_g1_i4:78-7187(-)
MPAGVRQRLLVPIVRYALPACLVFGACLRFSVISLFYLVSFFVMAGMPAHFFCRKPVALLIALDDLALLAGSLFSFVGQIVWAKVVDEDSTVAFLFGFESYNGLLEGIFHLVPDFCVTMLSFLVLALLSSKNPLSTFCSCFAYPTLEFARWRVYASVAALTGAAMFLPCALSLFYLLIQVFFMILVALTRFNSHFCIMITFPFVMLYTIAHTVFVYSFQFSDGCTWWDPSVSRWLGVAYRSQYWDWNMWGYWASYACVLSLYVLLAPMVMVIFGYRERSSYASIPGRNTLQSWAIWFQSYLCEFISPHGWKLCSAALVFVCFMVTGIMPFVILLVVSVGTFLPAYWAAWTSVPVLVYSIVWLLGQYLVNIRFTPLAEDVERDLYDVGFQLFDKNEAGVFFVAQSIVLFAVVIFVRFFLNHSSWQQHTAKQPQQQPEVAAAAASEETYLFAESPCDATVQEERAPRSQTKADSSLLSNYPKLQHYAFQAFVSIVVFVVDYSYVLSLVGLYFACLTDVNVINATYMLFFLVFAVSPHVAHAAWIFLVCYSQIVLLVLYIWQIHWTDKATSTATDILGLLHFEEQGKPVWKGMAWQIAIALFVLVQWNVNLVKGRGMFSGGQAKNEAFMIRLEQNKLDFLDELNRILKITITNGSLLIVCFIIFLTAMLAPLTIMSIIEITIPCFCTLMFVHLDNALVHLKRLWVLSVIVSSVLFCSSYIYQFDDVSDWLDSLYNDTLLPEYVSIEQLGFIKWNQSLFFGLLEHVVVLICCAVQARAFFLPAVSTITETAEPGSPRDILRRGVNFLRRFLFLYSPVITFVAMTAIVVSTDLSLLHLLLLLALVFFLSYTLTSHLLTVVLMWFCQACLFGNFAFNFTLAKDYYAENHQLVWWVGFKRYQYTASGSSADTSGGEVVPAYATWQMVYEYALLGMCLVLQRLSIVAIAGYQPQHHHLVQEHTSLDEDKGKEREEGVIETEAHSENSELTSTIPRRSKVFLLALPEGYSPLVDRSLSWIKLRWFLSCFSSCLSYQFLFIALLVALYYRAITFLGLFYLGVIVIGIQLPRSKTRRWFPVVIVFLGAMVILQYVFSLGMPPFESMLLDDNYMQWPWHELEDELQIWLLLKTYHFSTIAVDIVVLFMVANMRIPASVDIYDLIRRENGSNFPNKPRTWEEGTLYYVIRVSALCILLGLFVAGTASEDILSFLYLAFSLLLLLYWDFFFDTSAKYWNWCRYLNYVIILAQMLYQLFHASLLQNDSEESHQYASLQEAGQIIGLQWINEDKSSLSDFVLNLVIIALFAYQHCLLTNMRAELLLVKDYVDQLDLKAFTHAKALAIQDTEKTIARISDMWEEKKQRKARLRMLKATRMQRLLSPGTPTAGGGSSGETSADVGDAVAPELPPLLRSSSRTPVPRAGSATRSRSKSKTRAPTPPAAGDVSPHSSAEALATLEGAATTSAATAVFTEVSPEETAAATGEQEQVHEKENQETWEDKTKRYVSIAQQYSLRAVDKAIELLGEKEMPQEDVVIQTDDSVRNGRARRLLHALLHFLSKSSFNICLVCFVVNHLAYTNVLSFAFPVLTFAYVILNRSPKPWQKFWDVILYYTTGIVCLKFLFQIPGFCICQGKKCHMWHYELDAVLNPGPNGKCPSAECNMGDSGTGVNVLSPPYFFGIYTIDGPFIFGCIFDMSVIVAVLYHKFRMKARGLWEVQMRVIQRESMEHIERCKQQLEASLNEEGGTVGPEELPGSVVLELALATDTESSECTASAGDGTTIEDEEQLSIEQIAAEPVATGTLSATIGSSLSAFLPEGIAQRLASITKPIRMHFEDVFDSTKLGSDLYSMLFIIDFMCLCYLVLFQRVFTGISGDVQQFLSQSYIPRRYIILLIFQFTIIVVDRVIYVKQYAMVKLCLQYSTLLLYNAALFWYLPVMNNSTFLDEPALIGMYLLKCLYWLCSGMQLRYGYPVLNSNRTLMRNYDIVSYFIFYAYRSLPFVYELRTILDWTLQPTTLNFYNYFKVEDVYADLFIVKCKLLGEKGLKRQLGDPRPITEKATTGFCFFFILCVILWFPLIVLSSGSPGTSTPLVSQVEFAVGVTGWPVLFFQSQNENIHKVSTSEFNDLRSGRPFIEQDDKSRTQVINVLGYSERSWSITSPSKQNLLSSLVNANKTLYLETKMVITRPSDTNYEMEYTHQVTLDMNTRQQLADIMLTGRGTANVTDLLPRFLRLPGTTGLITEPSDEWINVTLSYTRKSDFEDWWSLVEVPTSGFESTTVVLYFLCYPVPTGLTSTFASAGIIGLYITVVLTIATFVRSTIAGLSHVIMFENLPECDDLIQLCKDILLARQDGDLALEEELSNELIQIYRNPELLIEKTRVKPKLE